MTAETKKGKYMYYRCTGFKGRCGNTYIREEQLSGLLGNVVKAVQIPTEIAEGIAAALRADDTNADQRRRDALSALEQRRRVVTGKLDRGYEDLLSGRISDESGPGSRRSGSRSLRILTARWAPRNSAPRLRSWKARKF
jgi:site-specific DNA recombinase